MKYKRLCIDVDSIIPLFVKGYLSGVGRTTLELLYALNDIKESLPFEVILYSQNMKGTGGRNLSLDFRNKHLYWPHREKYDRLLGKIPLKEWLTKYDILHIPHNFEYVYRPEKVIMTLHDALFMKVQENAFAHDRLKKLAPPLMRKCKAIVTCSEHSKQDIIETMGIDGEKITVIPWGVRHDLFYPVDDLPAAKQTLKEQFGLDKAYFFSVSCSMERKNTPRLIEVYLKLASQGLKHDLCLVWDAPPAIKELVNQKRLNDRVHFIHNVTDAELRLLYAGATATVYPSLYEGFGLPVLESMACGTPVIASDATSLPEVGGDVAVYINPFDNQSIESALVAFEENRYDWQALSRQGIARASKFTWHESAVRTAQVYNECLS